MLKDNLVLQQLKQNIEAQKHYVFGKVRFTEKYGFIDTVNEGSFFISQEELKKVLPADVVKVQIHTQGNKKFAEILELQTTNFERFVAKVHLRNGQIFLEPNHPNVKTFIPAKSKIEQKLKAGSYVVANLTEHHLKNGKFLATINKFICEADEPWLYWLVSLEQYNLPCDEPFFDKEFKACDDERVDFTDLDFFTIDGAETKDIDDALFIEPIVKNEEKVGFELKIAIADASAFVEENSELDRLAKERGLTNYLPNYNIPMLPRKLAQDLCSLNKNTKKRAVVCNVVVNLAGEIENYNFQLAWIKSKEQLNYDAVNNFLEGAELDTTAEIKEQIYQLAEFAKIRTNYRKNQNLHLNDPIDYKFHLSEQNKVLEIKRKDFRLANQMVAEAMIVANFVTALFLQNQGLGIFSVHSGFDSKRLDLVLNLIKKYLPEHSNKFSKTKLATTEGFSELFRLLKDSNNTWLIKRFNKWFSPAKFDLYPLPHFGMGLECYASFTSPIRKYSDLVNHRIIKSFLQDKELPKLDPQILEILQHTRKASRDVEKQVCDWLYCEYFAELVTKRPEFNCEIIDLSKYGLKVRAIELGAVFIIPSHNIQNFHNLEFNSNDLIFYQNGNAVYQLGQEIKVQLIFVDKKVRSLIGKIV